MSQSSGWNRPGAASTRLWGRSGARSGGVECPPTRTGGRPGLTRRSTASTLPGATRTPGSAVGVARAPALDRRVPLTHDGPPGPRTSHAGHRAWPSSSDSRRSSWGASSRTWVAHAVESVRTVRTPSDQPSGSQCAATSGADDLRPTAHHATDGDVVLPAVLGHEPAHGDGQRLRVAVVGMGAGAGVRAGPPGGRGRAGPAGRRRSPGPAPLARASAFAWASEGASRGRRPPSSAGSVGSVGCRGPPGSRLRRHDGPRPTATSKRVPRSASGTSAGTAAVTSTCSARRHQLGQPLAAARCRARRRRRRGSAPARRRRRVQQVVGREPQREREGPGLAVARRSPWPGIVPEVEAQLVAVRARRGETPRSISALRLALHGRRAAPRRARARSGTRTASVPSEDW